MQPGAESGNDVLACNRKTFSSLKECQKCTAMTWCARYDSAREIKYEKRINAVWIIPYRCVRRMSLDDRCTRCIRCTHCTHCTHCTRWDRWGWRTECTEHTRGKGNEDVFQEKTKNQGRKVWSVTTKRIIFGCGRERGIN